MKFLNKLSEEQKGLLYFVGGIFLLAYTLGIIERGFNTIFIIASIVLIGYGVLKSNIHRKITRFVNKKQ